MVESSSRSTMRRWRRARDRRTRRGKYKTGLEYLPDRRVNEEDKMKKKKQVKTFIPRIRFCAPQHQEWTICRQPPLELTGAYAACNMHEKTTKTKTDRLRRSLSLIIARLRGKRKKKKPNGKYILFPTNHREVCAVGCGRVTNAI